jgi:hypothetical protein
MSITAEDRKNNATNAAGTCGRGGFKVVRPGGGMNDDLSLA